MNELQVKDKISSLELVKEINKFRHEIEGKSELTHQNLLKVIRDEFSEEIGSGEILPTPYIHPQNKQTYECFNLTLSQAKQVLVRESKAVRKATIRYIEELEAEAIQTPMTFEDMMIYQLQELKQVKSEIAELKQQFDNVSIKPPQLQEPREERLYTSSEIGEAYGIGGRMVNIILRNNGVLFHKKKRPTLYARYNSKGYMKRCDGHIYWTEKGKMFVEQILDEQV